MFEAVRRNVQRLGEAAVELHDEAHGPLWIVATNDSYETSRLFVPGWLASFRGRVEGNPIAIVPDRDILMVGGDARPEMLERLLAKAEAEFAASTRSISPALYTVDDEGLVVPFLGDEAHPLRSKLQVAHGRLAAYEYAAQKATLDKLHEEADVDVFVASFQAFVLEDGTLKTLSLWPRGARTYLPRTAVVALLTPGTEPDADPESVIEVPFEAILDRLRQVPDLHPPRFEVGEFPE